MKLPQNEIDKFEIKLEESPKNYREYIKRILHLELQFVYYFLVFLKMILFE